MRIICFTWVLVWSAMPAMAASIEGRIKGERFEWMSAQNSTGIDLTSSVWDLPLHLPTAEHVVPGGAIAANRNIELKQMDGSGNASLRLQMMGVRYRLANHNASNPYDGGDAYATTTDIGGDVFVLGDGVGNKVYTLSKTSNPFTHYKPVFRINNKNWMDGMKGQPSGTYRGVLNYAIPYNYYRNGIIIRNTMQASLVVTLEYAPAMLTSVRFVTKNDDINPRYHGFPERMVGGRTEYQIEATGVFPNGVLMGLKPLTGRASQYQLDSLSTEDDSFITYSASCDVGCNGYQKIITDGRAEIDMVNKLTIKSQHGTTAIALISVVLTNTELDTLINDTYRGSFVLMFSAGL
ncbi:hypothetical protein A6E05_02840 [Aliivibrio sp. 1S165]|nr:hypothetical protein A6E05_02840 [Aliivibrio sp. 1S165]OCH32765.1 hypothetical protein A6E06_01625 [Aliivibrio sp. 1S175]